MVKKLRRKGIATHAEANEHIAAEYLGEHTRRFGCELREVEDYHGKGPGTKELESAFHLEAERSIGNAWVARYMGTLLQLKPRNRSYGPTRAKEMVCQWEDGRIEVRYRDETIAHEQIQERGPAKAVEKERKGPVPQPPGPRFNGPGQHPWKQSYAGMKALSGTNEGV